MSYLSTYLSIYLSYLSICLSIATLGVGWERDPRRKGRRRRTRVKARRRRKEASCLTARWSNAATRKQKRFVKAFF